ncbi:MAG: hypothetical protein EBY32_03935 [Proteobacteria bacterium]|nr:hypothetical protein [Pseudomonadota bacterium]
MEDQLKLLTALLSKLPKEDQKLASEVIKQLAPSTSVERRNLPATPATTGEKSNLPASANAPAFQSKNDELRDRLLAAANRKLDGNDPRQKAGTFLFDPVTNRLKPSSTSGGGSASYDLSGNPKETGPGSPDDLRTDRLSRMKEGSAGAVAVAEADRRKGIRDSVALPISDNAAFADGFKQQGLPTPGDKRDIFKDKEGRVEDPATLKARLIKEGMNPNDATLAAGQRYRDMFNPPNAKKDGFGMQGGQAGAVMAADPERRMSVMEQLKDARKDNLQALAEARRNDPFRKEVGTVTKIETSDGRVLAQRDEEVKAARGGIDGAVGGSVDAMGPMRLTDDGRRAIANRTAVATTTPEKLGFQSTNPSPQDKKDFENSFKSKNPDLPVPGVDRPTNEVRAVTGRFGAAVGGASITDQLKNQGKLPVGFELTPEQRTGQAPLPKDYDVMKRELISNSTNVAKNEGAVSDTGTRAAMLGAGPQGVAAIDTETAKAVADQRAVQASKASDATLRSIYSPAQMDNLDKTIAKASKTGGAVSPKPDGTFGIKEKLLDLNTQEGRDLAADKELTRRQTAKRRS